MKILGYCALVLPVLAMSLGQASPPATAPATRPGRGPIVTRSLSTSRPSRPAPARRPTPSFGIVPDDPNAWTRLEGSNNLEPDLGQRLVYTTDRPLRTGATSILADHKGAVAALRFSPDQKLLASGGVDGIVRLWDVATDKVIRRLGGVQHPITSLAFSGDSKRLAAGEIGGMIRVYEVASGKQLTSFPAHVGNVHHVEFLPDGKTIVSGGCDGMVNLWTAATGQKIRQFDVHDRCVMCMELNSTGTMAITASYDEKAKIVNLNGGPVQEVPSADEALSVEWGTKPTVALVHTGRNRVTVYDAAAKKITSEYTGRLEGDEVVQTPDGSWTASAVYNEVAMTTTSNHWTVALLGGPPNEIRALDMTRDGSLVAAAGAPEPVFAEQKHEADPNIFLWNLKQLGIRPVANPATRFAAGPDGKRAAMARLDGTVVVVESEGGKAVASIPAQGTAAEEKAIAALAFSPDGKKLLSSVKGAVCVWDADTGKEVARWKTDAPAVGAAWAANDTLLAGVGHELMEWKLGGTAKSRASGATDVHSFAQSADGKYLAVSFKGGVTQLIRAGGSTATLQRKMLHDVDAMSFSPDGGRLLMFDRRYGTVEWNPATGNVLSQARSDWNDVTEIAPLDDATAMMTYLDGQVRFLEIASGMYFYCPALEGNAVGARYVPQDRRLVFATSDGTVHSVSMELPYLAAKKVVYGNSCVSPDGRRAAALCGAQGGSGPWQLEVFDLVERRTILDVPSPPSVARFEYGSTAFSPDGKLIILAGRNSTLLFNAATGELVREIKGDAGAFAAVAMSPDGTKLASAQGSPTVQPRPFDAVVHLWDVATGKELLHLPAQDAPVEGIAWSPDGKQLLTRVGGNGGGEMSTTLWDAATGKRIHAFRMIDRPHSAAFFTPDGRQIVLADPHGTVELVDAATFAVKWSAAASRSIGKVAMSADGRSLLVDGGRKAWLLDLTSGKFGPDRMEYTTYGEAIPFFMGDRPCLWWNDDMRGLFMQLPPGRGGK